MRILAQQMSLLEQNYVQILLKSLSKVQSYSSLLLEDER